MSKILCPVCNCNKELKRIGSWNKINYDVCQKCLCWYQDSEVLVKYEKNYWEEIIDPDGNKRNIKKERDFKLKNWYGEISNFVNSSKPGNILDIGCGLGHLLSSINGKWNKYALEISQDAVGYIKQNYPDIKVLNQDLKQLTKNYSKTFDIIVLYHVIEHVKNPHELIYDVKKLLKDTGTIIIGTPNVSSLVKYWFVGNYRLLGPEHVCLYNEKSLTKLLNLHELRVKEKEFPFWKTEYFTFKNLLRLLNPYKISPPFYKSIMTFYVSPQGLKI